MHTQEYLYSQAELPYWYYLAAQAQVKKKKKQRKKERRITAPSQKSN